MADNEHLSLMPLMRAQLAHELSLYRRADWKQGTPPSPGHYLVTVQTDEGPPFVRLERWDGRAWVTAGGYVTVRAWDWLPVPCAENPPGSDANRHIESVEKRHSGL